MPRVKMTWRTRVILYALAVYIFVLLGLIVFQFVRTVLLDAQPS